MERLPEYTADLIHVLNALGMLVDRSHTAHGKEADIVVLVLGEVR
jgi:hypothetical protein